MNYTNVAIIVLITLIISSICLCYDKGYFKEREYTKYYLLNFPDEFIAYNNPNQALSIKEIKKQLNNGKKELVFNNDYKNPTIIIRPDGKNAIFTEKQMNDNSYKISSLLVNTDNDNEILKDNLLNLPDDFLVFDNPSRLINIKTIKLILSDKINDIKNMTIFYTLYNKPVAILEEQLNDKNFTLNLLMVQPLSNDKIDELIREKTTQPVVSNPNNMTKFPFPFLPQVENNKRIETFFGENFKNKINPNQSIENINSAIQQEQPKQIHHKNNSNQSIVNIMRSNIPQDQPKQLPQLDVNQVKNLIPNVPNNPFSSLQKQTMFKFPFMK
jgi:hypothetical protein